MAQKAPLSARKRNPTKAQVEAARAAGVPQDQLASLLSRGYKDAASVKRAVDNAIRKAGGTHAPQLDDRAAQAARRQRRRR